MLASSLKITLICHKSKHERRQSRSQTALPLSSGTGNEDRDAGSGNEIEAKSEGVARNCPPDWTLGKGTTVPSFATAHTFYASRNGLRKRKKKDFFLDSAT